MSLIILGKIGFAALGTAAVSIGGIALAKLFTPTTVEIYGFVSAEASVSEPKMNCQIGTEQFSCKIEEATKLTDESTTPVLLTSFKGSKTSKPITTTDTLDSKKFYKIIISETDFDGQVKTEWETKPITVIQESQTLGKMFAMFVVKDGSVIKKESIPAEPVLGSSYIKSFVGQASPSINSTDITDYKCYWQSEPTTPKSCKIFSFFDESDPKPDPNNTIEKLKLKSSETAITKKDEIKKNHYYLIQFTTLSIDSKKLSEFKPEDLIYAKNPDSLSDAEKVTFNKISAVAVVEEQLLILKQHS